MQVLLRRIRKMCERTKRQRPRKFYSIIVLLCTTSWLHYIGEEYFPEVEFTISSKQPLWFHGKSQISKNSQNCRLRGRFPRPSGVGGVQRVTDRWCDRQTV